MAANTALDPQRPVRVMVESPRIGGAVGGVLRDTFRVMDDMPTDIAHALDRLRSTN